MHGILLVFYFFPFPLLCPVSQEPMVGSQLSGVLLKMVDDSLDTRASFDDLREACSQHRLDDNWVKEEVNRLVTYVMGTAPEVKQITANILSEK